MKRLVAGAVIMVIAIAVQLVMVIRAIEPSPGLSLLGYLMLFVGMFVALSGGLSLNAGGE